MIIVIFNICIYCFRWKFFLAALRVPFANESAENKTLNIKVKKFIPVCHISNEMGYRWSNLCWGVAPPVRSPLAPENLHVWVGPHQCEHSEHPVQQQWKFLIGLTYSCLKYQLLLHTFVHSREVLGVEQPSFSAVVCLCTPLLWCLLHLHVRIVNGGKNPWQFGIYEHHNHFSGFCHICFCWMKNFHRKIFCLTLRLVIKVAPYS